METIIIMNTTTQHSTTAVCSACKHWNNTQDTGKGECRRHAPQSLVFTVDSKTSFESRFPVTSGSDWCGDFERA